MRSMEADEIGVVLGRASELHAKICEAIDRASKYHHLRGTGGQVSDFDNGISGEEGDTLGDDPEDVEKEEGLNASEVRSLGCIRDALEMLETQLESLQVQFLLSKLSYIAVKVPEGVRPIQS